MKRLLLCIGFALVASQLTAASGGGGGFIYGGSDSTTIGNASDGLKVNARNAAGTEIFTAAAPGRIDPTGTTSQPTKTQDGAGNNITSQANSAQRALDVGIDVSGVQVDPRAIRALTNADIVKAQVQDNAGNGITSTAVSGKQRLDVTLASAGADGAAAPSHSNLSGGVDPDGNQQAFAVDRSGNLDVTQVGGTRATYSAAITDLVAAALATDIFTITGSGTKTVRVTRIEFSGTETTGAVRDIQIIKRSTANSAGTSTTLTAGSFDSTNAAATATVRAYTVNPTLGATVALVRSVAYGIPAANLSGPTNPFAWDFGTRPAQIVVLRGTGEVLAVNLNGVTATGSLLNLSVEWTEE